MSGYLGKDNNGTVLNLSVKHVKKKFFSYFDFYSTKGHFLGPQSTFPNTVRYISRISIIQYRRFFLSP